MMRILWLAFFVSGIAGISYELVWAKYLVHLFGATTPAISGTISIFFGGLALGAILLGRLFDRLRNPIRAYGILEIAIGVTAALVPWMVRLSERWLVALGPSGETWPVRLLLAATVLLVPATLIGATFPAMAAVARWMKDATRRTALFYGINTTGAVLGCLLTGFWTIPAIGLKSTTLSMAAINVAIGLTAVLISRLPKYAPERPKRTKRETKQPEPSVPTSPRLSRRTVAILAGCSGLLAIGTEVLWVRALVLSFHATVYVFAIVLTSFLIGVGGGSLLLAFLRRFVKNELTLLAALYLAIGLGCFFAMVVFPNFQQWESAMRTAGIVKGWGSHVFAIASMALLAMLPATLAMGASLPLLIGLADIPQHESRTAGLLYGLNTLGGIIGSLLATFGLMPLLGLSGALMVHLVGYLALFALVGFAGAMSVDKTKVSRRFLVAVPSIVAILLFSLGIYPEVNGAKNRADARRLFYRDAPSGTVGIYTDAKDVTSLWVNNYYGLSDTSPLSIKLQNRLGHLPMLLHPSPKRALLVGLATGTTLSAMAQYPLQRLDCVELHPTVIEVAHYFDSVNNGVWKMPTVRIQNGDGRRFLQRAGPAYDVIVGDLYLPSNAGVGALFSLEHFHTVKDRLAANGVFVAWLPLHQLGPQQVASVARTFLSVFPDAEAWMGNWGTFQPILGLVGWKTAPSSSSQRPSIGSIERRLWELSLQEAGLEKQSPIPSRQLLSTHLLSAWARNAPVNTYDHPIVEYGAPRAMLQARIRNQPIYSDNHKVIQRLLQLR